MNLTTLKLKHLGWLAITGRCEVFGLGIERHGSDYSPIYLNLAGPATAVEAVWARLAQGKELTFTHITGNHSSSMATLRPKSKGMYERYQTKIEGLNFDNLILVPKQMRHETAHYIFVLDQAEAEQKLYDILNEIIHIPFFREWMPAIVAHADTWLRPFTTLEGNLVWKVSLISAGWDALITKLVKDKLVTFPA